VPGAPFRLSSVTTQDPVRAGSGDTVLSFNGRGFLAPDNITPYFAGNVLADSAVESANLVTAVVPAALLTNAGRFTCYLDGGDSGVSGAVTFTVLTEDGQDPVLPGDPCTEEGAVRKASNGVCVTCTAGTWEETDDSACNPSSTGDLTDIYVYGLETHEKFFDHFEIEMRDAPDGNVLQFHYADGHYTEDLELWTMNNFALFEGVTRGQTYYFHVRTVTGNGIPSQWSEYQSVVAEVLPP
jgi:hypothetical protein